jgi:hypothetical protein
MPSSGAPTQSTFDYSLLARCVTGKARNLLYISCYKTFISAVTYISTKWHARLIMQQDKFLGLGNTIAFLD